MLFSEYIDKERAEGRAEGKAETRAEDVNIFVDSYLTDGISAAVIIDKLIKLFHLTELEAEQIVRKREKGTIHE